MFTFDSAPVDLPQLSPWMRHQQSFWKALTHVPSPPSHEREAHEPISGEKARRLQPWRLEADGRVDAYTAYIKTPAGAQDLADLDQSRQQALESIAVIGANDRLGECRQRFLNAGPFYDFLKATAHPAIALLRQNLRWRLAEYKRDFDTRPSHSGSGQFSTGADYVASEAAWTKQFEERKAAIQRAEAILSDTYATHADALAMLTKAKAAESAVYHIRRDDPTLPSRRAAALGC